MVEKVKWCCIYIDGNKNCTDQKLNYTSDFNLVGCVFFQIGANGLAMSSTGAN